MADASKAVQVRTKALELSVDVPTITLAQARRTDVTRDEAKAWAAGLAKAARVIADAGSGVMFEQAKALHAVQASGLIGTSGAWLTQGDYAEAMGLTKGAASKAATIGRALVVHGVRPGSTDYTTVVDVVAANSGSKATRKAVRDALKGDDTEALKSALKSHREYVAPTASVGGGEGGGTGAGTNGDGDGTAPEVTVTAPTVDEALSRIDAVRMLLLALTREEQDRCIETMHNMIAAVRKSRPSTVAGEVTGSVQS